MQDDFVQACLGWQTPTCQEYRTAVEAVQQLNITLGCFRTLAFANATWYRPHLMANTKWCRWVATVWVKDYLRWWKGEGEGTKPKLVLPD